jgi:hypothetical protein
MGGAKRIGPQVAKIGLQRQAQSKAAVAGSKAEQAKPKPTAKPASGSGLPGILGRMADWARGRGRGGGSRQMSRPMGGRR